MGLLALISNALRWLISCTGTSAICVATSLDIPAVLENPTSSRFWDNAAAKLLVQLPHSMVDYDACAHGGARPKATSLWVNHSFWDGMAIKCDGQHEHESWQPTLQDSSRRKLVFPTSSEAQYPDLFCERVADCLLSLCALQGALSPPTLKGQAESVDTACDRITLGALPRGAKHKPLVSDFGSYVQIVCHAQRSVDLAATVDKLPKGSRIVSRRVLQWGELQATKDYKCVDGIPHPNQGRLEKWAQTEVEVCTVGVPSDPLNFLQRAMAAGHPRGMDIYLGEAVDEMLRDNFLRDPYLLAKKRIDFFKHWLRRAEQLEPEEQKLHETLPEHLRHVLKGKRLLVWQELLQHIGYPDTSLISDIQSGFRLSGWLGVSGVFPRKVRPPACTQEDLKAMAPGLNESAWGRAGVRQPDGLARQTWEETKAELERGWIFRDDSPPGDQHLLAVRFGIEQSAKVRVIDDCRPINRCAGLQEKLKVHSVDRFCAIVARAFQLHHSEGVGDFPKLVGRTLDLTSAYKQFGVSSSDREWLRILVQDFDQGRTTCVGVNALPFGAVGSVQGFLRAAISIWTIGLRVLSLCWSSYFDDYPCLSRIELARSTEYAMTSLFKLLGVQYAAEGKKATEFTGIFKMLGLQVDLATSSQSQLLLGHTDERRKELFEGIQRLLTQDHISFKDIERLRGRMIFFEGYAFGRIANWAHKALSRALASGGDRVPLDFHLRRALELLSRRVMDATPLCIHGSKLQTWLVFTDGAYEGGIGSVGGVLVAPDGRAVEHFGDTVPDRIIQWLCAESRNPIYELEVLPCLIAAQIWGRRLQGGTVCLVH